MLALLFTRFEALEMFLTFLRLTFLDSNLIESRSWSHKTVARIK